MKFLKLRYFYLIALFLSFFLYLFPTIFHIEMQKEWIHMYFGNLIYLLFFVFLLYGIRMWIEETGAKIAFEIRIFFFVFCFLSALSLILFHQVGVNLQTLSVTEEMRNQLLNISIYRYQLGLIGAYGLYSFSNLTSYPFYYYCYFLMGVFGVSFFLLGYKPVQKRVKQAIQRRRDRKKREREERLLKEQMQIKRALEREEYRKKLQFEQRKSEMIQERAREFEMGNLMASVDLSEEEKKEEKLEETAKIQHTEVEEEENFSLDIYAEKLEIEKK